MKKKLAFINVVCNASTGKIMVDLAKEAQINNYEVYCFFGRGKGKKDINCLKIGNNLSSYYHGLLARIGFNGHGSYFATKKLVKILRKINPDIIHLHNIHGYYLNLKVLFKYLKNEYKGKIVWTLHDCWAFTGHCSYFTKVNCNKWQNICYNCPQLSVYPKEYFDTTKREYKIKKKLFNGVNNLKIVVPSNWLKELVKKSFLKDYPIVVINNGIDLDIFKPTIDKSIYNKYNIPNNKKIVLGVANIWEERKGLNDFIELSSLLDKDYQIVLVGVDNKTKEKLPKNIISIARTDNQSELVALYSIAYVFLNLTYEDNYPTVNLESIACKTPVITYDTGGCNETLKKNGIVVQKKNYKEIIENINNIDKKMFSWDNKSIDKIKMIKEYLKIYD